MLFGKKKNEIKEINQKLADLTSFIKTKEHEKLLDKSNQLDTITKLLKDIHISLERTSVVDTEEGKKLVFYFKKPIVSLGVDENGEIIKNDFFYAINYLGLTSIEDMETMQKNINQFLGSVEKEEL